MLYKAITSVEVASVGTVSCFFTTTKSGVGTLEGGVGVVKGWVASGVGTEVDGMES